MSNCGFERPGISIRNPQSAIRNRECVMTIDEANQLAVKRILDSQPILVGIAPAAEMIPGMRRNLILHAGPPITWDRMSGPLRGAVIGGLFFEGLAPEESGGGRLGGAKERQVAPCRPPSRARAAAGLANPSAPRSAMEELPV